MGLVDGVVLGAAQPLWALIVPTAGTNFVTNPSFEVDTAGWTVTSATLTRTAGAGVFGAYGGRLLASATNGKAGTTLASVASGTHGVVSAYVRSTSPLVQIKVTIGASSAVQFHPGDGAFHRIETPLVAPSTTTPVVEIIDTRTSAWDAVDVDAVQFGTGVDVATTYIDGDQDGCSWTGTPHASTSTRDGRDGRGGALTALDVPGSRSVTAMTGIGAPDVDVVTQPLAFGDGEVYQRATAKMRVIQLAMLFQGDGTTASLHAARKGLLDLVKPDLRRNRGPLVLRYAGTAIAKRVQVYYEGGFGWDTIDGPTERTSLRLLAPDPSWAGETEQQAQINVNQTLSGLGFLALYDGQNWSNLGGTAAAVTNFANKAIRLFDGLLVVAGSFNNLGGVAAADNLAVWDGSNWVALGGITPNAQVRDIDIAFNGSIVAGGDFTSLGGDVNQARIAQWTPGVNTWSAYGSGTNGIVKAVMFETSVRVWAAGDFTAAGGVGISKGVAFYDTVWHDTTGALPAANSANVYCLAYGPDSRVYCAVGGNIYRWDGATWAMAWTTNGVVTQLKNIGGTLNAAGTFTQIGGVNANRVAWYNGAYWQPFSSGVSTGTVSTISWQPGQPTYIGGNWQGGTVGGITTADSLAYWNGNWNPLSTIDPPNTATHTNDTYQVWTFLDGRILIGWQAPSGTFGTTMAVPGFLSNTTLVNVGSANAYPIFTFTSSGTVYYLENLTTGQRLTFSGLIVGTGETAALDLRPGKKTFTTPTRSLLSTIVSGSDLASFVLVPGTNMLAFRSDAGSAAVRWQPRYWSADG